MTRRHISGRTIFIGDVHGCLVELVQLLDKLRLRDSDHTVLLGDFIDRGPYPAAVVDLVRLWPFPGRRSAVLGNHDRHATRFVRAEQLWLRMRITNKQLRPSKHTYRQWMTLSEESLLYLESLPLWLPLHIDDEPWVAVHAGLVPHVALAAQAERAALHLRWIDASGRPHYKDTQLPVGGQRWATGYDGEHHVVYGHAIRDTVNPTNDTANDGWERWGLDTGCVFGGNLTALEVRHGSRSVIQVPALRQYTR
jgi:hypothetical protein